MNDTARLPNTFTDADPAGTDSGISGQADGPDRGNSASAFSVGDRVVCTGFYYNKPNIIGTLGVVENVTMPRGFIKVLCDDGQYILFAPNELTLVVDEPVPFELTVEAENALDEPLVDPFAPHFGWDISQAMSTEPRLGRLQPKPSAGWVGVSEWIEDPWTDVITNPPHYSARAGVECWEVAETFGYRLGNVIKYVWRADAKGNKLKDLLKARQYLDREIASLEGK